MLPLGPFELQLLSHNHPRQDGAQSHRERHSRKMSNQSLDIHSKLLGLSLNTKTSTHGGLTDRNGEDFAPVTLDESERYLLEMMGEDVALTTPPMQTELRWMMEGDGEEKSKYLSKDGKRDLIVNWVALVHTKYRFDQETFHRTVNIIDKYIPLENQEIDYELLAVAALWMAAKIEERRVKQVKSWAKLGKGFTAEKILEMEARILQVLNYNIIYPTSDMFLREFLVNYIQIDQKSEILCLYLLELSLMQKAYTRFKESILAASSIYVCFKVRSMSLQYLDRQLSGFISENYDQIRECSRLLCRTLQRSKNPQSPVYRKFASKRFLNIAHIGVGRKSDSQPFDV